MSRQTQGTKGPRRVPPARHRAAPVCGSQAPKLTLHGLAPGEPLHVGGHLRCGQRGGERHADQGQGAGRALIWKPGSRCLQARNRATRARSTHPPGGEACRRSSPWLPTLRVSRPSLPSTRGIPREGGGCSRCPRVSTLPGTQRAPTQRGAVSPLGAARETALSRPNPPPATPSAGFLCTCLSVTSRLEWRPAPLQPWHPTGA